MRCFVGSLIRTAVLASVLFVQSTAAFALEFPEQLAPVAETDRADVRVEMKLAADGRVLRVKVLSSSQPELDKEVIETLRGWHFSPQVKNGVDVEATVLRGFVFAEGAPVDSEPRLSQSPGALSYRRGDPEPQRTYPMQSIFIEDDPADTPVALPNEIWLGYSLKSASAERKLGQGVLLDVVTDASGAVMAARDAGSAPAILLKRALPSGFWRNARFEPGYRGTAPVAARVRVPVRFYLPTNPMRLKEPEHPREMNGVAGRVAFRLIVEADGQVHDLKILASTDPRFEASIIEAFSQRQEPAERLGKPVAMSVELRYTFRPRS
ncbi:MULTISPECIES: TonB family protein [Hydrocarboniphaga]|uniref:TonB family protein n=1 Tax=Hydrocarboniphaga TaxID=243627 RepID=UPI00058BEE41|nr:MULTISPECIES: TonB family protein [Hydrocarboniphaga]MDZ4080019.1 TonB family protein [Hydrocarboniphaga sp.]